MRTRRPLLLAFPFLLPALAMAQRDLTTVDGPMVARIRDEGLQRSQMVDLVSYLTDVLGPRLTGSRGMQQAQAWAVAKMQALGLQNVMVEQVGEFGVPWDNERCSLHMLAPAYQPLVGYPLAHTPGTDGRIVCEATVIELHTADDCARYRGKLQGRAVLVSPPAPLDPANLPRGVSRLTDEELKALAELPPPAAAKAAPPPQPKATAPAAAEPAAPRPAPLLGPKARIDFLKAEGVVAVLQCDGGSFGLVRGFSRPGPAGTGWSKEQDLASLPILAIAPEQYNRMHRILSRGIPVRLELDVQNRIGDAPLPFGNVVGEIPGSDLSGEVVMLGAHFDSWHQAQGASDDGAGCAVALEAARILLALQAKPRRTIRVAWWNGEEQGLCGSRAYVAAHFGDPRRGGTKPGHDQLSVYFNQDYGAGAYRGINLQGNAAVRPVFAAWMAPFADLGMTMTTLQSVGSTDHVSFDEAGLPGFQFLQDRVGLGGHSNMDVFDTLVAEDLRKNAVILAAFVWHAAMADDRLPRKPAK